MNTGVTGGSREVGCDEFIASHCEYLDDRLAPAEHARLSAHAESCATCARYDRIVRKSLALVREVPQIEPSEDFELRLQHRLFHVREEQAASRSRLAGAAATFSVAAAIALLAWSPLLFQRAEDAPAVATFEAPGDHTHEHPVFAGFVVPLISEPAWVSPTPAQLQPAAMLAAFPGPYSPLVVTPPAHRSVRTISTEYTPAY